MNWFGGSIPEAIGLAKSTDAIFVVYIHDESEASATTDETLADEELASVLSSKKFVAIKLENRTEGSNQFSQIYPVVVLPSLYFISGSTGMPLEILGGAVNKEKLKEKLDQFTKGSEVASTKQQDDHAESSQEMIVDEPCTSTSSPNTVVIGSEEPAGRQSSSTAPPPAPVVSSVSDSITDNAEEEMISVSTTDKVEEEMTVDGSDEETDLSLEEKMERAKVLLAEAQAKKAAEQAEEQRRKEVERRKMGQEVAKRKRQMQDEEVQSAIRERKKEKDEDRAARERVRAQIAADRLEREKRVAMLQAEASAPAQEPSVNAHPAAAASRNAAVTRLKFRMPDGSSSIAQFLAEAKLAEVRRHVEQQLVTSSSFMLTSTVHPRPFSSEDSESSLSDLGLVPSAIIVILLNSRTSGSGGTVSSQGGITQLFWILLSPITFLLGFLRQIFSRGNPTIPPSSNDSPQAGSTSSATSERPSSSYGWQRDRLNREGNIHRLRNSNDDEDNNTWNGNSTQQM